MPLPVMFDERNDPTTESWKKAQGRSTVAHLWAFGCFLGGFGVFAWAHDHGCQRWADVGSSIGLTGLVFIFLTIRVTMGWRAAFDLVDTKWKTAVHELGFYREPKRD
jgi:hypothetical protein